jgi:hypothetical protein
MTDNACDKARTADLRDALHALLRRSRAEDVPGLRRVPTSAVVARGPSIRKETEAAGGAVSASPPASLTTSLFTQARVLGSYSRRGKRRPDGQRWVGQSP